MTELKFHGPFHFDEVDQKTGKIERDGKSYNINTAGIYIWGFMYEYNEKAQKLGNPCKSGKKTYKQTEMQFIPYYVGKSQKHIFRERILHHHDVRNTLKSKTVHAQKYTRLHLDYMTEFFMDKDFPLKVSTPSREKEFIRLLDKTPKSITYYNNPTVLKKIYSGIDPEFVNKGYPITEQKHNNILIKDDLDDLVNINKLNNFWFCFAENNSIGKALEIIETTVFYSLKGKTISMTRNVKDVDKMITIQDKTNTRIFNQMNGRLVPTPDFLGY